MEGPLAACVGAKGVKINLTAICYHPRLSSTLLPNRMSDLPPPFLISINDDFWSLGSNPFIILDFSFFLSWSTSSCQEILLSLLLTSLQKLTPSLHLHCYGGHHPLTWIVPEPPASPPPSLPSSTLSSLSDSAMNVCVPPKFKH